MSTNNVYSVSYAVVDSKGAVTRTGVCSLESLQLQGGPGLTVLPVPEGLDDDKHYWDGSGWYAYPPKPGDWAEWDGEDWIDPRPEGHEEQELADRLQAARQSASLTKLQFILAVVRAGLVSEQSGLGLSDGILPPEMSGLTDTLTDEEKFELTAKLKTAIQVDRLDPFILAAGAYLGMTDAQIDILFGISL